VRRNESEGLWSETEWDGGTLEYDRVRRRDFRVRRNGTEGLW
jgi:hypothetical protein